MSTKFGIDSLSRFYRATLCYVCVCVCVWYISRML